jgi:hypothetical protein
MKVLWTAVLLVLASSAPVGACISLDPLPPDAAGSAARSAVSGRAISGRGGQGRDSLPRLQVSAYAFRPYGLEEVRYGVLELRSRLPLGLESRVEYARLGAYEYLEQSLALGLLFPVPAGFIRPAVRLETIGLGATVDDWAALIDLDVTIAPAPGLVVTARLRNPAALDMRRSGSPCPARMEVGAGYEVTAGLRWGVDVVKTPGFETGLATGVEWRPLRALALRTGLSGFPRRYSCGMGIGFGPVGIDVATSWHTELGATFVAGVTAVSR